MKFGIPTIWKEPINHIGAYYFYSICVAGVHKKKRKALNYPNFPSAIRPEPHSDDILVSAFKEPHC